MISKNKIVQFALLACLSLCGIFSLTTQAAESQDTAALNDKTPLVLGIFPRRNPTTTIKFFTPLARYLSDQLGRKVKLKTERDFPTFLNQVSEQGYDIVHYNQYQYIKSHKSKKYMVIAQNEEFGDKKISGSILVRKDSGLNSLQDLKNKTIIFGGGKTAMVSYVMPTALLRRAGLKNGDYKEEFSKNPPNTLLSIYYKQADAAGIGHIILKLPSVTNSIDISKIKSLATSTPLAHLPWAVKTNMPSELQLKIKQALLSLNNSQEGLMILKKANLTGIHHADDHDYDAHRKILKEVFGNKY